MSSPPARRTLIALLLMGAVGLPGCPDGPPAGDGGNESDGGPVSAADRFAHLADVTVSDVDALYDVPPEIPFDPSEWTTSTDYPLYGDPAAKRGESDKPFLMPWQSFLTTLRTDGPNSNSTTNATVEGLLFETLVGLHPETEEYHPLLASHWRVEDHEDGTQSLWFRIDERARFADGAPVTAVDVHASWWHRTQEDRSDPSNVMSFRENYDEPEILDRLTLRVRTREQNWRLFLYFGAGMLIYPAKYCHGPGDKYLDEWNWRYMPGSGPYHLKPEDISKGDSVTLTRRDDWWAENERWAKHTYNFDRIKFLVISDAELQYEKFKTGDLPWYPVSRAQRWVEDIPKEEIVQKGWVQRRRIFNQGPVGFAGLCFNMRKPPFDDKRVRLAFAHLFNREQLMKKVFFDQYEYTNSIFPGRDWGNGEERDRIHFDPDRAEALLAEAGYAERDGEGYLVGPDGKRLSVTLEFQWPTWERIWLIVKEDYEDAGIEFNLKLIDASTFVKRVSERQLLIHFQSFGSILFPNPETSFRSDLADKPANNNMPGFKSARVDELCEEYNKVSDRTRQKEITREVDTLVAAEVPYAYGWHASYRRILYWDKFGHPDTYVTRTQQYPWDSMMLLWWWDADKIKALDEARKTGASLPQGEVDVRPWADK